MAEILYKELSYAVVGCAQRVHAAPGPGLPESVYHRALCHELAVAQIPFQSHPEYEVVYEGHVCGTFKPDIVVEEKMILERKATDSLCTQQEAQAPSYLKASGLRLAILINFGETSLVVKRLVK